MQNNVLVYYNVGSWLGGRGGRKSRFVRTSHVHPSNVALHRSLMIAFALKTSAKFLSLLTRIAIKDTAAAATGERTTAVILAARASAAEHH